MKHLLLAFAISMSSILQAQVTIGSNEPPVSGALLELKSDLNGSSDKGLALPRVLLSDPNNLYPMFEPDGTNYKIGTTKYTKADEDQAHTGLVVYNAHDIDFQCTAGLPKGLYIWDGEQWNQLSGEKPRDKGSYASDVAALKELYDSNPGVLNWDLSTEAGIANLEGVVWSDVCGEQRVTSLTIVFSILQGGLISSDGIGKLYMLTQLTIIQNKNLTQLDVSQLIHLKNLACYANALAELDVSKNINLTGLMCHENKITHLDLSKNIALSYLHCRRNKLTQLDLSANKDLMEVWCDYNYLPQAELNKLVNLPNYCDASFNKKNIVPQYRPGTTTIDPDVVVPICP